MPPDDQFATFEGDAMLDLLSGNEESFKKRLSQFDPEILCGLFERSKDLGRSAYQKGEYALAIEHYTGALALANTPTDKAKLFANRSQCYVQMKRYEDGLKEAHKAIAVDSKWCKAWFRAGRCLAQMERWEAAHAALLQSSRLVSQEGAEASEITQSVNEVTKQLEKEKKKRRYATDYTRFQKLSEQLVSEEMVEEYKKQLKEQAQPDIEFASDLTAEQRRALELQLTGKVDQPGTEIKPLTQKVFDLSLGGQSEDRDLRHEEALRALLTLQSEGRMADRLIAVACSPIVPMYERALSQLLSVGASSVLFCGIETYPLPLHAYRLGATSRIQLLNTSVVPVALDLLLRFIVRDRLSDAKDVHLFSKSDLKRSPSPGQDATEESTSVDEDENVLDRQGAAAIDAHLVKLNKSPELLVFDPSHIEGCLFGSRYPIDVLTRLTPARILPSRIELRVAVAEISHDLQESVTWSLLPEKMPRRLRDKVTLRSEFYNAWTLTVETMSEIPSRQMEIPVTCEEGRINCVIFALKISMDEHEGLDTWTSYSASADVLGHLVPHFFWLRNDSDKSPESRPTRINLHFNKSMIYAATVCDDEGSILYRSDQRVIGTSDKFGWETQLDCGRTATVFGDCLKSFKDELLNRLESRAKYEGFMETSSSQPVARDVQVRLGAVSVESPPVMLQLLKSLLRRKPVACKGPGPEVEVSLDVFVDAATAAESYKKLLRNRDTLRELRDACWESFRAPKVEWHHVAEKQADVEDCEGEVRTWLFARERTGAARVEVRAGDLHLVRCPAEEETAERRRALCEYFNVPLDTPGVDDVKSCVRLLQLWEGMIFGTLSNLAPNGVASGMVASIVYAKQALLTSKATICPGRLRVLGRLCHFDQRFDSTLPMLNCGRPVDLSQSLPYGKRFHYGEFKVVESEELKALGVQLHPTTIELFDLKFNGDVDDIVGSFNRHRIYKIASDNLEKMRAILIWCEWTMVKGSVICTAPLDCCSAGKDHLYLDSVAHQALQILPPLKNVSEEHQVGLQLIPFRGYRDFVVTWHNVREDDVDEEQILSSDVFQALSDRNSENAIKLSNQLMMTPELTFDLMKSVIGLARFSQNVGAGELDLTTLNNFLAFLAA